jgi:hypothetical protein
MTCGQENAVARIGQAPDNLKLIHDLPNGDGGFSIAARPSSSPIRRI